MWTESHRVTNDVTKQWLNLDGRGVIGYRTKGIPDTHPVQETVHMCLLNELTTTSTTTIN